MPPDGAGGGVIVAPIIAGRRNARREASDDGFRHLVRRRNRLRRGLRRALSSAWSPATGEFNQDLFDGGQHRIDIAIDSDLPTATLADDFTGPFIDADSFNVKFGAHCAVSLMV